MPFTGPTLDPNFDTSGRLVSLAIDLAWSFTGAAAAGPCAPGRPGWATYGPAEGFTTVLDPGGPYDTSHWLDGMTVQMTVGAGGLWNSGAVFCDGEVVSGGGLYTISLTGTGPGAALVTSLDIADSPWHAPPGAVSTELPGVFTPFACDLVAATSLNLMTGNAHVYFAAIGLSGATVPPPPPDTDPPEPATSPFEIGPCSGLPYDPDAPPLPDG